MVELRVAGPEAGIHRQELDPFQAEVAMPLFELILPAGLRGIDGQETDQMFRMLGYVIGDIPIVDPHVAESGFATEDDGCYGL